ncbi:MAG: hypothetical protein AAGU14_03255 [Eubacteriaceae bacterium]
MERKQIKQGYENLYNEVLEILWRHDPIGIGYLSDEYEPETGTILPRIKEASSQAELRNIIYQEFVKWFNEELAGKEENYNQIAHEIWECWNKFISIN